MLRMTPLSKPQKPRLLWRLLPLSLPQGKNGELGFNLALYDPSTVSLGVKSRLLDVWWVQEKTSVMLQLSH